jgi:EAL domain-containing protein (putative c-di-GMP-specific phosphodiesterase class I)
MSLDMGWSRRIKEAIDRNRFALACQPIVDTRTRRVECYEVLLRLRDGEDVIMPAGFLPSAERFGLSVEIDQWVIRHAIEHLARRRQHEPAARYSINLSGQTVGNPAVCDQIVEALARTRVDPAALTFEVTETVAISDMPSAEAFLSRLKDIGCRTALDDFGSGMCSFAYLKDLPADFVKIDGRFVRNLAVNTVDQAMVRAMNEIVHAIGKLTIAEFVETPQAMQLLADFGVDYAQGIHLGRAELVPDFLEDTRARG